LIRRQYNLQQSDPNSGFVPLATLTIPHSNANWLFDSSKGKEAPLPALTYEFEFTEYGIQFMRACAGPKQQEPTEGSSKR
jgi:hypothetical protein